MEDDIKLFGTMEDDLNFKENGRRPQFVGTWKTTSICRYMEEKFYFICELKTAKAGMAASPELGTAQPQLVHPLAKLELCSAWIRLGSSSAKAITKFTF